VAGVQRGGRGENEKREARSRGRKGNARKDAIVFSVFYVHQINVKILIGQN
jgi:hypothetical protein